MHTVPTEEPTMVGRGGKFSNSRSPAAWQCSFGRQAAGTYSRVHTTQTSPGSAQVFENLGLAHASVDAKNLGSA